MKYLIELLDMKRRMVLATGSKQFWTTFLFIGMGIPFAAAQTGRVGINVTNPLATLHVADSSVLFTGHLLPQYYDPTIPPPVSGGGTRMMWYESHGAFRVGTVTGAQWDMANTGAFSFASGNNVTASGHNSACFGSANTASGFNSMSIGSFTVASGSNSLAAGSQTIASSLNSASFGQNTTASGFRSAVFGYNNMVSHTSAFAMGENNKSRGNISFVAGTSNMSDGFASFSIGRFPDTTANVFETTYNGNGPLFVAGNGTSHVTRNNAMTILYNGNVGLDTKSPAYRFHVVNDNPADGGFQQGIMIENTNTGTPGEASLSFRNKSIPADRQWMVGINEVPPHLSFAYGSSFTTTTTHMMIDTFGNVGINTTSPQAPLHVIRNSPSGGMYSANPLAIFESNNISYIQLSHENTDETGILSGNQATSIRSAIVFVADSSIDLRAGGNGTDLKISTEGNVGIGIYTPTAKLDVNGSVKLGTNGTVLSEIIKSTVVSDLPNVVAGSTLTQSFTVTSAAVNSVVSVSPDAGFNAGFVVASARVSAASTVEVRFVNTSGSDYNPPSMEYHFTLIR